MPTSQKGPPYPVAIIGMGMSPGDLTAVHLDLIAAADLLVGGHRHLAPFRDRCPELFEVTADLKKLAEVIRDGLRREKRVVVLASGDPLYFGIGSYLARTLGQENVRIYPNITSVAAAFARIGEPWQDVPVVSLHGRRQEDRLARTMGQADRIAVFTDPTCSPQWVGNFLMGRPALDFQIGVFECMGTDAERISWHRPETIREQHFNTPNMVILKRMSAAGGEHFVLHLGMPESAYAHEQGLITKAEVRAVTLARLELGPRQVLWDLGAGSGAVAIEASLLMPGGRIVAVEKNPNRIEHLRTNRDRFGVANLDVVETVLPDGLGDLPDPDRVFIGGGGKALVEIIAKVCRRLTGAGVLVVNTVLMDNFHDTVRCMRSNDMDTDVVQIQASRSQPLADSERMQAMNPVWVIRGRKKRPDGE